MKICFYAHDWNYIDNYEPVIKLLVSQKIDYEILFPKKNIYSDYESLKEKYKEKYGETFITLLDVPYFKYAKKISSIPLINPAAETVLSISATKSFLRKRGYSHLVLSDDRIIEACALIKSARKAKIKNIILYPVEGIQLVKSLMLTKVQVEQALIPSQMRRIASKISKIVYPANTSSYNGNDFYFYPPREILNLYFLGIFPKNPWARGSNALTKISVNSQMQLEENLKFGISKDKMAITGFPPHDSLKLLTQNMEFIRQSIRKTLGLNSAKKIFLIIGTNYSDDFQPSQFPQLNDEIQKIISSIISKANHKFEFVFKVHPRVSFEEQMSIFPESTREKLHFVKDEFSVYELISISDASINFISAAMDSALITDAPILCYKIPGRMIFEEEIKRYKSITPIFNPENLEKTIKILANGGALFDEKLREKDRANLGIFDGKNAERFVSLLLN